MPRSKLGLTKFNGILAFNRERVYKDSGGVNDLKS